MCVENSFNFIKLLRDNSAILDIQFHQEPRFRFNQWRINKNIKIFVRNLQCLDPKVIATKPEHAIANFMRVLQSLGQSKKLNIRKCDDIRNQFS